MNESFYAKIWISKASCFCCGATGVTDFCLLKREETDEAQKMQNDNSLSLFYSNSPNFIVLQYLSACGPVYMYSLYKTGEVKQWTQNMWKHYMSIKDWMGELAGVYHTKVWLSWKGYWIYHVKSIREVSWVRNVLWWWWTKCIKNKEQNGPPEKKKSALHLPGIRTE